jgi:hypothetical protein
MTAHSARFGLHLSPGTAWKDLEKLLATAR